ncbi:MAG: hypothetical protein LUH10_00130 [Tannerellaceae bacterium]|nr:hypothetical protein [Tannerellaceae bacterium]
MQNIIKNRQTLADFAIQECGTLEAFFEIAAYNGYSVTQDPVAGETLEYDPEWIIKKKYRKNIQPATAITASERDIAPWDGIGYMAVEINFFVS